MIETAILADEPGRVAALRRLAVLDTAPEEPFENVVALVRSVLQVPMAAVSLLDEDRQWFKAKVGLDVPETARDVSFCTFTIQQIDPLVVSDATLDERFSGNPFVTGDPSIRSYAGIPLRTRDGYNIGALCAIDVCPREFSESQMAVLANLAGIVMNELELRRAARRDPLTGVHSRRSFLERLEGEIDRFYRYDRPASLILVDVDHFKSVNDTHGHPGGDRVLRSMIETLAAHKRPSDVLGRLGGEEFAVLMPETSAADALIAADRLRQAIEDSVIAVSPGQMISITASFGIAELCDAIEEPEAWLAASDAPLYAAKRGGRNRCERA